YRLLRELGRGGMGVVYEAEQVSLGRRVALKVLPAASTLDPRQLQRFQAEARAAAALRHPSIVPVYAVGCEEGVHLYAMQLLDGQGQLWVADFGLALFGADRGLTRTGDLVGTLRYMSPEQARAGRGLVDHRTDVYALGATLYELLTLRPLFDGADAQALLMQ